MQAVEIKDFSLPLNLYALLLTILPPTPSQNVAKMHPKFDRTTDALVDDRRLKATG